MSIIILIQHHHANHVIHLAIHVTDQVVIIVHNVNHNSYIHLLLEHVHRIAHLDITIKAQQVARHVFNNVLVVPINQAMVAHHVILDIY